jgi:hypothetical protein
MQSNFSNFSNNFISNNSNINEIDDEMTNFNNNYINNFQNELILQSNDQNSNLNISPFTFSTETKSSFHQEAKWDARDQYVNLDCEERLKIDSLARIVAQIEGSTVEEAFDDFFDVIAMENGKRMENGMQIMPITYEKGVRCEEDFGFLLAAIKFWFELDISSHPSSEFRLKTDINGQFYL